MGHGAWGAGQRGKDKRQSTYAKASVDKESKKTKV